MAERSLPLYPREVGDLGPDLVGLHQGPEALEDLQGLREILDGPDRDFPAACGREGNNISKDTFRTT